MFFVLRSAGRFDEVLSSLSENDDSAVIRLCVVIALVVTVVRLCACVIVELMVIVVKLVINALVVVIRFCVITLHHGCNNNYCSVIIGHSFEILCYCCDGRNSEVPCDSLSGW